MSSDRTIRVGLDLKVFEYEEVAVRAERIGMTVPEYVHRQALLSGPETVAARPCTVRIRMTAEERARSQGRSAKAAIPLTDYIRRALVRHRLPVTAVPVEVAGRRVYEIRLRMTSDESTSLKYRAASVGMYLTQYVNTILSMES